MSVSEFTNFNMITNNINIINETQDGREDILNELFSKGWRFRGRSSIDAMAYPISEFPVLVIRQDKTIGLDGLENAKQRQENYPRNTFFRAYRGNVTDWFGLEGKLRKRYIKCKSVEERKAILAYLIQQGYRWHGCMTNVDRIEASSPFEVFQSISLDINGVYMAGNSQSNALKKIERYPISYQPYSFEEIVKTYEH